MGWKSDPATIALLLATVSFALSGMQLMAAQAARRLNAGGRAWATGTALHGFGWGMLWQAYAWPGPALSPLPELCFLGAILAFSYGVQELCDVGRKWRVLMGTAIGTAIPLYAFSVFPGLGSARMAVVAAAAALACFFAAHRLVYHLRAQPRDLPRAMTTVFLVGGVWMTLRAFYLVFPELPGETFWARGFTQSAGLAALLLGIIVQTIAFGAIESLKVESQLHRLAALDPLTEVFNRRVFETLAEREITRVRRHGGALSLIALDLDHFKAVNDTWGHAVGDAVLRAVVSAVSAGLRSQDLLGRMGGEEFSILVPSANLENAFRVAERVRFAVAESSLTSRGSEVRFTISLGVAELVSGEGLLDLSVRADQALYRAKACGRNRVEAIAADGQAPPSLGGMSFAPEDLPSMAHWSVGMITGDSTVDAQHEQLFALVRAVRASIAGGQSSSLKLGDAIAELRRYTREHFRSEEELMERAGYPHLEVHRRLHGEVLKQTADLVAGWKGGRSILAISLSQFLSHWLVRHVQEEDVPMIRWLQQHGSESRPAKRSFPGQPNSIRIRRSG